MAETRLGAFGCLVDAESPKHQQEQNTDGESHLCHSDHHGDRRPTVSVGAADPLGSACDEAHDLQSNGHAKLLENPSALQLEIAVSNAEPLISTHLPTTGIYG